MISVIILNAILLHFPAKNCFCRVVFTLCDFLHDEKVKDAQIGNVFLLLISGNNLRN